MVNESIYVALTYQVCALNAQSGVVRRCAEDIDRTTDAEYVVDGELAFEDGMHCVGASHTLIAENAAMWKPMWSARDRLSYEPMRMA